MFTCESPSQVFFFIFNSFGKAAENLSRLKVLGYDRTCDFHPFLERLAKRGNLGAQLLLSKVKFLVDKFHCEKHTEATCFTPDNSRCKYHPDLERFSEIQGMNTECAEQFFKWLGSFKYMCKKMSRYRFCIFFVWNVVDRHNKRKERQLAKAGLM